MTETNPPLTQTATVTLRPVTIHNLRTVRNMDVAEHQQRMVAPNADSIAEAHFHPETAWFRAIYADDLPVGFVMLRDDAQAADYYLWRLMVDQKYQGLGFGRRAVEAVIAYVRTRPGATQLLVSCVPGEGSPCPFYEKLGFMATGKVEHGESFYRLDLVAPGEGPAVPPLTPLPTETARFDFWIGEWTCEWEGGRGRNQVRRSHDGWVILENFDGSPGMNLRGTSVSVYDLDLAQWRQTWVDNQGSYLDLIGGWEDDPADGDGPRMALYMARTVAGKSLRMRMLFTHITADAFDWQWQASTDEGDSWQDRWSIRYTRAA